MPETVCIHIYMHINAYSLINTVHTYTCMLSESLAYTCMLTLLTAIIWYMWFTPTYCYSSTFQTPINVGKKPKIIVLIRTDSTRLVQVIIDKNSQ